jgi:hypothetical protein
MILVEMIMSKFINQIESELMDDRYAPRWIKPLSASIALDTADSFDREPFDEMRTYKIKVEYKLMTCCFPRDKDKITSNVVSQMREEIYGEFRVRIHELQRAILSQDSDTANSICRDLLTEMYGN